MINIGLTGQYYNSLAVDPLSPTTLYVGANGGVFKSTNGGGSWNAVRVGLSTPAVRALVIHPVNPAVLYAGTDGGGVFKSTGGAELERGEHWLEQSYYSGSGD